MKKWILIIVMFMLLLPMLEQNFNVAEKWHLNGAIDWSPNINFSAKKWFSKEFQEIKEKYLNEQFGFREIFVRSYNQIRFTLFNKSSARNVVLGKEDYLYEKDYIEAHFGKDFIGEDKIKNKVEKIKFLQDTLEKLGKTLIFVFAPNKADFFPEFIPDSLVSPQGPTNYKVYKHYMDSYNINLIDFNSYFMLHKKDSPYPLYPKHGIHWSQYGAVKAGDSIIKYIEKKRNWNIPNLVIDRMIYSDSINEVDYDIGGGMNLLKTFPSYKMAYPVHHFERGKQFKKPTCMVLADSYYWNLYNAGFTDWCYTNGKFVYYYQQIYPENIYEETYINKGKLKDYIAANEIIIIMTTSSKHLTYLGFDFIEEAYPLFVNYRNNSNYKARIEEIKSNIRKAPEWMISIQEKAKAKNISIDSMIVLDATYVFDQELGQNLK